MSLEKIWRICFEICVEIKLVPSTWIEHVAYDLGNRRSILLSYEGVFCR